MASRTREKRSVHLYGVCALAILIIFVVAFIKSRYVVINPVTGKYDPVFQQWFNEVATGNSKQITISMGNSLEGSNYFAIMSSPALKKYPEAKTLRFSWQFPTPNGSSEQQLIYDRVAGTMRGVSSNSGHGQPGRAMAPDAKLIVGVTDEMIHKAAQHGANWRKALIAQIAAGN